jgi:outer membrane protein
MKYNYLLCFFCAVLTVPSHATLSLKESFHAARLNMESIKRADAVINQSEEFRKRARAAVLPTISGVGSYTTIDRPDGAGSNPFLLIRQHSAAIRLNQPLIRGGTVSAYELAKDNILLARFQKNATEISLYQLIINAYFNLNIAQVDNKNIQELLNYSRERVSEIRERTRVGRSRKGELIEAEAQLSIAESQFRQTLISLNQAEKNFEFFTRMEPKEIMISDNVPKLMGPVSDYLEKVRVRPDILAMQQETKIAERQISIAKGGHLPSLDLTSNYYLARTGILSTSEWDVGVAVVIPLFQGGGVVAAVKEAAQEKRIAELRGSEALRAAERDVSINYQTIVHLQEQLKSLKLALVKAEQAYRVNKKDYMFGLVTNLDVLQSLNVFIETKRTYNGLIAMTHMNHKNLEASIGVLP